MPRASRWTIFADDRVGHAELPQSINLLHPATFGFGQELDCVTVTGEFNDRNIHLSHNFLPNPYYSMNFNNFPSLKSFIPQKYSWIFSSKSSKITGFTISMNFKSSLIIPIIYSYYPIKSQAISSSIFDPRRKPEPNVNHPTNMETRIISTSSIAETKKRIQNSNLPPLLSGKPLKTPFKSSPPPYIVANYLINQRVQRFNDYNFPRLENLYLYEKETFSVRIMSLRYEAG